MGRWPFVLDNNINCVWDVCLSPAGVRNLKAKGMENKRLGLHLALSLAGEQWMVPAEG
jgi:hypothetical protein